MKVEQREVVRKVFTIQGRTPGSFVEGIYNTEMGEVFISWPDARYEIQELRLSGLRTARAWQAVLGAILEEYGHLDLEEE